MRHVTDSGVWSRSWRLLSGMHGLALVDQAVVSGTSFLTTVLVGRWTNSSQLGIYAIALSFLVSAFAIQDALVSLPYTIHRQEMLGTAAEHTGSSLVLNGLFSALTVIVLTLIALGLSVFDARSELGTTIWMLAGVAPFALLREFGRRVSFAHLVLQRALALDTAVAWIQISLLSALGWTGRMSAVFALTAIGVACALSTVMWLFMTRREFVIRWSHARTALKKNWDLGKWLLGGQLTVQVQSYVNYWLSVAVIGPAATGIYAACMSVVSAANPFISGLGNILMPRAVLAWRTGGVERLRAQAIRDSLLLGAVTSVFCVLVLVGGENLIRLLYRGKDYARLGDLVTVLSVALLAQVIGVPASNALASVQRPRAILWTSSAGAAVTVLLVWPLMVGWGLLGAACGLLIGNAAGSIARWAAFLSLVDKLSDDLPPVMRVLKQETQNSDDQGWEMSRLGEGTHATVHEVRSKHWQSTWPTPGVLVIKLFKPGATSSLEMVHAQFQALSRLYATMDGRVVLGWKVVVPQPLYLRSSPLALVMTGVRGRDLYAWTATGEALTPEVLANMARVTVGAMQQAWALGRHHGDLALQNIMCDAEARHLSFIDPGTPDSCRICNGVETEWPPGVRDMAHILSDVTTDVRQSIGNRNARSRRQIFAASALQAFMESAPTREDKRALLDGIADCANAHLQDILDDPSWSPRGLWLSWVRLVAVRRLDTLLTRLRAELDGDNQSV